MEKVLVLFSGGLDSMLVACKLIEEGYEVVLVHYDNGCSKNSMVVKDTADRLIKRYGNNKVSFWGIGMIVGYYLALRDQYFNMKSQDVAIKYPNLMINQVNCLTCRTAMYLYSVLLCQKLGIKKIAEGARKSQLFAIEQENMIEKYKKLLQDYGMELLTPIIDLISDRERELELMMRQITPKVLEPQCLLGYPMEKPLTEKELNDVIQFYQKELEEPTKRLIKRSKKIPLDGRGRMF